MTCLHCGKDTITMEYTLRCTPEKRVPRDVDVRLCTDCLRRLRAEPDIELVGDADFAPAD
jgi:hypothetical protein